MRCPYCNLEMSVIEMDLGIDKDTYTCTNPKCLPEVFVPHAIVPMNVGATIQMLKEIDKEITNLPAIFTKKREGYRNGLKTCGKMILSVLAQQGFIIKDGDIVLQEPPKPEKVNEGG